MNVVLISGRMGSGKDEVGRELSKNLNSFGFNVAIIHFADPIKRIAKEEFGWDGKKDEAGRRLLQILGTEAGRKYNPDLWAEKAYKDILDLDKIYSDLVVIIPDWRFLNECSYLEQKKLNVTTVRVESNRAFENQIASTMAHESENSLPDVSAGLEDGWYDYVVDNNGTLEELKHKVLDISLELMEEFRNG